MNWMKYMLLSLAILTAVLSPLRGQNFIYDLSINSEGRRLPTQVAFAIQSYLYLGIFTSKAGQLDFLSNQLISDTSALEAIARSFERADAKKDLDNKFEGAVLGTAESRESQLLLYRYYLTIKPRNELDVMFVIKITFKGSNYTVAMEDPIVENIEILQQKEEYFDEEKVLMDYLTDKERKENSIMPPPPPKPKR